MTVYNTGHVKRDPTTNSVAVRTQFPDDGDAVWSGKTWLIAAPRFGARFAVTADVDAWPDLYTPPTSITVPAATVTAGAGATHTKQLVVTGSNGLVYTASCTYVSSNTAKALVNASGLVTGVAAGSATILVTFTNPDGSGDLTYNVSVTVT